MGTPKGFDRNAWGWDVRFAGFLTLAPVCCVAIFALGMGLDTAQRLDIGQGLGAAIVFFVGGLWIMAFHYVVATIPSFLIWGLAVRSVRGVGLGTEAAMRIAAPITALAAALLLYLWLGDEDYRALIPAIAFVSVPVSFFVADRIVRSHAKRKYP